MAKRIIQYWRMSVGRLDWCNCCWPRRDKSEERVRVQAVRFSNVESLTFTENNNHVPEIVVTSPKSIRTIESEEFHTARTSRQTERNKYKSMQNLIKEIKVEMLNGEKEAPSQRVNTFFQAK